MELTIADGRRDFAGMDAVVFRFTRGLVPWRPLPADKNPGQAWVCFSWESPSSMVQEDRVAELPVHATWTYYRGSEITTPYGFYKPGKPVSSRRKPAHEWVKGKTRLIAWMSSNCKGTFWPRTDFVRELQRYVQVDAYGTCGDLKCQPAWSAKCNRDLLREYKFYLSLENSECEDYITEKLWNKPLLQGVVPVVYGPRREIYEELLPPNSFIYIGDYKNVKELADYLKVLNHRTELYAQYLQWQYRGSVEVLKPMHGSYDPSIFCNLIPVIRRVKRGEMKRRPVKESSFAHSCRSNETFDSNFGLDNWNPW
ncbi:glycoprotein 3-alpha-L-fucosyltransferase A-like [Acanthaster planci]|uniref:Fucosyltransferase n=1 Tax=Acanthaster planci TaxID=133434 RepID=A0A8B7ZTV9_ACAPL|nr:glycoprotein 3-alpha-L-fucosyltransferase A-like [Acanthaster planci]